MKYILVLLCLSVSCIGAELTTRQEELTKDDIIRIYKVPVDQTPAYKARFTCSPQMLVTLLWEASSDEGRTWKEVYNTGFKYPINSGQLMYKIDAHNQATGAPILLVEFNFSAALSKGTSSIGGVLSAERKSLDYELTADPGSADKLLYLKQGSVHYRLSLRQSK